MVKFTQNSYTDDELAGAQACVEFEQYVLMICSVPFLKFASAALVNYTVEKYICGTILVKTMVYKMLATKDHLLQISALMALVMNMGGHACILVLQVDQYDSALLL